MSNSYCISEMDANECLNHIADDILHTYGKCVESFEFVSNMNNSKMVYDGTLSISSFMPASVIIGTKDLANNRVNGYVRTQDFVNCIHMIYHEERHLQQHIFMYKDKNATSDIIDMAKFQTICSVFPEFDRMSYYRNPAEVDAEIYGFEQTVKYFDSHFLDDCGKSIIDARKELCDMIHDMHIQNYGWYGDTSVRTYDAALCSLKANRYYYKRSLFPWSDYSWEKTSKHFDKFLDGIYGDVYSNTRSPLSAMEVLYEYAIDNRQVHLLHYSCLRSSVNEIKSGNRIVKLNSNKSKPVLPIFHGKKEDKCSISRGAEAEARFADVLKADEEQQSDRQYGG